jgi:ribosomal subunit interface protein
MKLTITGRHMDVPEAARQAIDRKMRRLDRVLNDSAISGQCVLWEQRGLVVCELIVHARQDHTLHAIGRHAQFARAVGLAADKVGQQAQRLKDRWTTRRRGAAGAQAMGRTRARAPRVAAKPRSRAVRAR